MATNLSPKNWIAIGAAGALSLGVMASGAVTAANAMPLFTGNGDRTGSTSADVKGTGGADVTFRVNSDSIVSPSPTSPISVNSPNTVSPISPSPASPASVKSPASNSPASAPAPRATQQPAPQPAPVAPAPQPNSPDSPDSWSPPSPASPASIDSPASWSPPSN